MSFNADTPGIHRFVGFKIIQGATRTPGPRPQRTPIIHFAWLTLITEADDAGGEARAVVGLHACWCEHGVTPAAREALLRTRFEPKPDTHVRFGASYRMPFVFRISGASTLADHGVRAKQLRPAFNAAQAAVEKLRHTG